MNLMDRGRAALQARYEHREPERALAVRNRLAEITGLSGAREIAVIFAEWESQDPFVINPHPHFEIRKIQVFKPGDAPPEVEYVGKERHTIAEHTLVSSSTNLDTVDYSLRTYIADPTHPFFRRDIIRAYLINVGLGDAVEYGMRHLTDLQKAHKAAQRQGRR